MDISKIKRFLIVLLLPAAMFVQSCSGSGSSMHNNSAADEWQHEWIDYDTVQARKFDTGKMWTFEYPPKEYWQERYGFNADDEWLEDVRKSALRFSSWCSASFVSEDGLIMTNHHCVDFITNSIQEEGENISQDGFYAPTLEDERKVPNLYVDQLLLIEDVTEDVHSAMDTASTPEAKIAAKEKKIKELEDRWSEDSGLHCEVTGLYKGGKYSLYGYKRYTDVRAVFVVETNIGFYGGDPDNFTYPRYNLDCSFLRVYDDNGEPLKTDNFFKFSTEGAKTGEPLFVIGRPGSTNRMNTVEQLLYRRDVTVRNRAYLLSGTKKMLEEAMEAFPEKKEEINQSYLYVANSEKVYTWLLAGLRDRYLIARKKDFQEDFVSEVKADPELEAKYGDVWESIAQLQQEKREVEPKLSAYMINPRTAPDFYVIAARLVQMAQQLQLPAEERKENYKDAKVEDIINSFYGKELDMFMEKRSLALYAGYMRMNLGEDNDMYNRMYGNNVGLEAADYLLNHTFVDSKEEALALAEKGPEAILNSGDPLIDYVLKSKEVVPGLREKSNEISETENVLEDRLGQALFDVYGDAIPPDATSTLRISDGEVKDYEYNGTVAPVNTTFHGMFERYNAHGKKHPWDLPEHWLNADGLDRGTPFNFISTCDITGGSSGSAVINGNAELVGLAFDGNIESIPGDFIYTVEGNRMVSVASQGMLAAIKEVYHADRLAAELKAGKMVKVETEPEEEPEPEKSEVE